MCQDCWKNTRSTFKCMVILKSRGQGPKRLRTTGQICPKLSTRIWTLSHGLENNHTFKCWSGIFLTILTYMIMLENCHNNISVYGCCPIQGTKFYSCWNFMKPGSQSGTYAKEPCYKRLRSGRLVGPSHKGNMFIITPTWYSRPTSLGAH